MRGVFVRNVGVGILALALTVLASCNSDPLSFDVKDTAGIVVTPTYMVLTSGKTAQIFSRTVNQGQEPTYEVITAAIDATCGAATLTVEPDNDVVPAEPPGRFDVTGGSTVGTTCITLTGGGATATVEVVVVGGAIEITNNPGTVRAGDAGTLEARLVDSDGNPVEPYDVAFTTWASDNSASVDVSAGGGAYTTATSGTAVVTVTWLGQEGNGTAGIGVDLTADAPILVDPNVPVDAYFTVTGDSTLNLGAFPIGEVLDYQVTVVDAFGNVSAFPDEVTGITVTSDIPAVTATDSVFVDDPFWGAGAIPVAQLTTEAAGLATISGVIEVSTGPDLPFSGTILVVNPTITSVVPASGSFAEFVTITGTDFVDGETQVYVDGYLLGNWTVDSPTQITAQMPTWSVNPAAPVDIYVTTAGVQSPPGPTWTQTIPFDEAATEDNSFWNTGGQADISVPAFMDVTQIGEPIDGLFGTQADWFFFAISGGTRTIDILGTPVTGDEDVVIDVIDGGFNFFWCSIDNTGAPSPDGGECELPGAGEELDPGVFSTGTWWVIPTDWAGLDPYLITLEITMVD